MSPPTSAYTVRLESSAASCARLLLETKKAIMRSASDTKLLHQLKPRKCLWLRCDIFKPILWQGLRAKKSKQYRAYDQIYSSSLRPPEQWFGACCRMSEAFSKGRYRSKPYSSWVVGFWSFCKNAGEYPVLKCLSSYWQSIASLVKMPLLCFNIKGS